MCVGGVGYEVKLGPAVSDEEAVIDDMKQLLIGCFWYYLEGRTYIGVATQFPLQNAKRG